MVWPVGTSGNRGIFHACAVGACLVATGCAASGSLPATTPAPTTTITTTTTSAATTTTQAPTTTLDRVAEIEAIFRDLEERRLDALYRKDEEAFRALFANEAYWELDRQSINLIVFQGLPEEVSVELVELLADTTGCIAASLMIDLTRVLGTDSPGSVVTVIQKTEANTWGYSYVGNGWDCIGPHPLESGG